MCRVGEECSQEVADLLERCIRTNVDERPTAKEIVAALQVRLLFTPCKQYTQHLACYIWSKGAEVVREIVDRRGHKKTNVLASLQAGQWFSLPSRVIVRTCGS